MAKQIVVEDTYLSWVRTKIVPLFAQQDIKVEEDAIELMAWSMQMQVRQGTAIDSQSLFGRAETIGDKRLTDYYQDKNGKKDVSFNRAFHLLADWGFVLKYPWGGTGAGY